MAGTQLVGEAAPLPPSRPASIEPRPTRGGGPGGPRRGEGQRRDGRDRGQAHISIGEAGGWLTDRDADQCLAGFSTVPGSIVRRAPVTGDAVCALPDGVVVEALAIAGVEGSASRSVRLEPPPTLACPMARAVADWLATSVQPLAKGHFGQDLVALRVGGGHECRRRNRASAGAFSEHATGAALDIFGFRLGEAVERTLSVEKPAGEAERRFLDSVRASACGSFSTALGPGADASHANHLHVDLQNRRSRASRFCQ